MYSSVTVKGQVTIPVDIRKKLNIKPGDVVKFNLKNNGKTLTVVKIGSQYNDKGDKVELLHGLAKRFSRGANFRKAKKLSINQIREKVKKELASKYKKDE